MGLFNYYTKPGPGISKDAPKKKGLFLYLELFTRKFSKLVSLNMLYFICSLPMTILYFLIFAMTLPNLFDISLKLVMLSVFLAFLFTAILGSGPASAAMAYVLREYSKENHVWLISTFFSKMKENFKKEMAVAFIDLVFTYAFSLSLIFYIKQSESLVWFALMLISILFGLIFMIMHYYIHQLIVTFEDTLMDILKNSLLFSLSTFIQCVFLTVFILVFIDFVCNELMFLTPAVPAALIVLILMSFVRFPVEFFVYRSIKKTLNLNQEEPDIKELELK